MKGSGPASADAATLLWVSDLHLDRGSAPVAPPEFAPTNPPCPLLLTGDLSNATRLVADLAALHAACRAPIHFVLGNHDHYGSSVEAVRDAVIALHDQIPAIEWLPRAGVVPLGGGRALVGVDGWADGRHGDALRTPLVLNDDRLIAELAAQSSRVGRLAVRRALADADADRLATLLAEAVASGVREILVATHVPPWIEAIPMGHRVAHPHWYPLLICGATGDLLSQVAASHPDIDFVVLTGHTHVRHTARIAANLTVRVARPRQVVAV